MGQLQWHEPASYRRAIYFHNERTRPLDSAKFAITAFLILIGLRLLVGLHPDPDAHPPGPGITVAVAFVFALLVAYGLPALMSLAYFLISWLAG